MIIENLLVIRSRSRCSEAGATSSIREIGYLLKSICLQKGFISVRYAPSEPFNHAP